MKQTAVEWLENQVKTSKHYFKLMEDMQSRSTVAQPNIFKQAKTMEKEQIIKAANILLYHGSGLGNTAAEQHYNETFKKD